MTAAELQSYQQQLLELKQRLGGQLTDLEAAALRGVSGESSGGLSAVPIHLADLGSDTYAQEIALGLMENEQELGAEVLSALERIEQDNFGRCEECGQEITKERLRAVPYTCYCIRHAR